MTTYALLCRVSRSPLIEWILSDEPVPLVLSGMCVLSM